MVDILKHLLFRIALAREQCCTLGIIPQPYLNTTGSGGQIVFVCLKKESLGISQAFSAFSMVFSNIRILPWIIFSALTDRMAICLSVKQRSHLAEPQDDVHGLFWITQNFPKAMQRNMESARFLICQQYIFISDESRLVSWESWWLQSTVRILRMHMCTVSLSQQSCHPVCIGTSIAFVFFFFFSDQIRVRFFASCQYSYPYQHEYLTQYE